MCVELASAGCLNPYINMAAQLPPEATLRDLIWKELNVHVSAGELRLFLRYHWTEVARLAHKIHGSCQ